ncbi:MULTISPECIES: putative quinol monooxygenase [Buttiauxella]|uniref:putative quinol monooxygenase n=1 Tax=Buttiauxella TaxID=82976 RepID=UPI000EF8255C|nr:MULTISPECIES: putative quinol monooxygenase [Buttiauxella]AYN26654.1 antibiotic biosynthesis monooxygenase [Buttiauxella sp. 3AFRM03]MCE0827133.1 antibiotic biosynthesis monooxygenase [Buttiauxella ferragutiae]TDN55015.1 quinol monooxygenase YgiN [Buttiauxella sp. JUb87]UNK62944.1 antibiotic biosynthesis monooxygenase [Buttiauxella ferragutiae]
MADNTLSIIAVLKAKAGQREQLKSALQALISPTRKEEGCLDYALFQLEDTPDVFYMRESWKGQEALDAHIALPHFQAFVQQMDELLAEPLQLVRLNAVEA